MICYCTKWIFLLQHPGGSGWLLVRSQNWDWERPEGGPFRKLFQYVGSGKKQYAILKLELIHNIISNLISNILHHC